jgi:hypothetical protein
VAALQLQSFVDRGQHAVGGVCGPGDIRVGQDGEQLWWRAAQDSGRVDVAYCAGQSCGHGLERFLRWTRPIGLDQENAEVSLVAVGPSQLVFENGPNETIVEESRRPINDMERLRLGVVDLDSTPRAENRPVWQGRPASQACLSFRPAA